LDCHYVIHALFWDRDCQVFLAVEVRRSTGLETSPEPLMNECEMTMATGVIILGSDEDGKKQ
jgi:hypothetical protein